MRIGSLDKFINFEAETRASDGQGRIYYVMEYRCDKCFRGHLASERQGHGQRRSNIGIITHKVRIRFRRVLRSAWRISWAGRYFAIVAPPIDPNMKHEWLDLMCKEAVL